MKKFIELQKINKEKNFDFLQNEAKRINKILLSLFIGEPYKSKIKPNKKKTYTLLQRLLTNNIAQMGKIFNK